MPFDAKWAAKSRSPSSACGSAALPPSSSRCPKLTRTSRSLRTVRTGYAYQPPACYTYQRRRAACLEAPRALYVRHTRISLGRAVRTAYRDTTGERWPSPASSPAALASPWRRRWASPRRSGGTSLPWATATTGEWARRSAARSHLPCLRRSCALRRCERGRLLSEGALCLRAVRGITRPTSAARSSPCAPPTAPPRHRATAPPRYRARRPLTRCSPAAPEP